MSTLDKSTVVGVIGAGTMGGGIAQLAATFGHSVVVFDADNKANIAARIAIEKNLNRLVEKNRLEKAAGAAIFDRTRFVDRRDALADCSLIVEAIVENIDVKKEVFASVEGVVSAECVLASNTSSLSIAAISSACKVPGRVLGVHFFNPAPLMPLVEIVPGLESSEDVVSATRALIDTWDKTTVMAKDTPGFIVNRVARPFYGEALRMLEEGVASFATIDWAMKDIGGFRMGPFELMDLIGNDVNYQVTESVFEAFFYDPRYKPSFTQKRLVEAKRLGRKAGRGFYNYNDGAVNPEPDRDKALGEAIFTRILVMLINEAADALFWNVSSRDDIDLAMTRGVNYPRGLLKWADDFGLDRVLERLTELQEEFGEDRYRPSPLLKRMVRAGRSFY